MSDSTGLELPSAMLYENPSVGLLSSFVSGEIEKHRPAEVGSVDTSAAALLTTPQEENGAQRANDMAGDGTAEVSALSRPSSAAGQF